MGKEERWVTIEDAINLIDENIEIRNYDARYMHDRLNQQDREIRQLKEQLKNAIIPKFNIGQQVYLIDDYYSIIPFEIDKILIRENGVEIKSVEWNEWFKEDECFITREEAEAKLKELKGE